MADVQHYRDELARVVRGEPWVVAVDVLVSATATASRLVELGADRVLAIGGTRGTGELPDDPRIETHVLGVRGRDMMHGIRACEAALEAVPDEVRARVDAFDPDKRARVVRALFSSGRPVAGRRVFGPRRPEWIALEDKTRVDDLWDAAGVPRAPSLVVPVTADALAEARARLDVGAGTVWVADNREGWHGGAHFLRWVRSDADAEDARAFLSEHADRVRVMPFLDGVPCSIHGVVFPETVVAFRPCEMMVFRVPGESRLAYAAASTFWLPAPDDSEEMRDIARRVGAHLRRTVGYRGCFTVDGVMTADGFRPTELNPRYGAALPRLVDGHRRLPLYLLHLAIVEGEPLDYRPRELERLVLDMSMEAPTGRAHRLVAVEVEDQRQAGLVRERGRMRLAREGEEAEIDALLGPAATGGFLMLTVRPGVVPMGPPLAPLMVEAFAFLDEAWELGIGPLEAATDVR